MNLLGSPTFVSAKKKVGQRLGSSEKSSRKSSRIAKAGEVVNKCLVSKITKDGKIPGNVPGKECHRSQNNKLIINPIIDP